MKKIVEKIGVIKKNIDNINTFFYTENNTFLMINYFLVLKKIFLVPKNICDLENLEKLNLVKENGKNFMQDS